MTNIDNFSPLNISRKFAICGLPIRVDTYRTCSFKCEYCFANNRIVMPTSDFKIGDVEKIKRKLDKIFNKKRISYENFLDVLISNNNTWHCGGMSDPFQPCEKVYGITKQLIEVTKPYNISILFSTKTDDLYSSWDIIDPDLHTFQLSVTNVYNNKVEPNVADISKRYNMYRRLKNMGFRVGIRIQPFIPNITTTEIIDMFSDADHFTIEGIKLISNNKRNNDYIIEKLGLNYNDFVWAGTLNMKTQIKLLLYEPFIKKLEFMKLSYSIADNELHHLGNNFCCCGDKLINKSTTFNNTYLSHKYGKNYNKKELDKNIIDVKDCKCGSLFNSEERKGLHTVQEFFDNRFFNKNSIFSPQYLYDNEKES